MQSTPNPKLSDDPHDFIVVAPDAVRVAPADEEISNLLQEAARRSSKPQTQIGSDFSVDPPVPPVDTTFRPAVTDTVQIPGHRRSISRSAIRGLTAVLLTACIGGAAIAWQSSGTVAKQIIGKWAPKLILTSLWSPETQAPPAQPAPPAVQADATAAAPQMAAPQTAAPAQTASEGVAPPAATSSEAAQLQSMARDLASARQEIEQLKASQEQMSRDIARVSEARVSEVRTSDAKASDTRASERNPRPRISALPSRPAVAPARRPMPPPLPPPQASGVPPLPQATTPYVPRQPEPLPQSMGTQSTGQSLTDPELASVPRPPMPLR